MIKFLPFISQSTFNFVGASGFGNISTVWLLHLLMCALLLDCEGNRLELICIGLWFAETFWHITFTSLLFCFTLRFLLFFLDLSVISFVIFDFLDVLLYLLHDALYSLDLLSVENWWLHHLLNRLLCCIGHCATWGCHCQCLDLNFKHFLCPEEVRQGLIDSLELHFASAHLENCRSQCRLIFLRELSAKLLNNREVFKGRFVVRSVVWELHTT